MNVSVMATRAMDRVLNKVVPQATAKADQYECTWQYGCVLPYCGGAYFLSSKRRQVCAGTYGPSYGPWISNYVCCR